MPRVPADPRAKLRQGDAPRYVAHRRSVPLFVGLDRCLCGWHYCNLAESWHAPAEEGQASRVLVQGGATAAEYDTTPVLYPKRSLVPVPRPGPRSQRRQPIIRCVYIEIHVVVSFLIDWIGK
jgi:hypothetical protein